jgi:tetratricopeptide (TPR) repeat protein
MKHYGGGREVRAARLGDGEYAPSELLMSGKIDEAIAAYRALKRAEPASRFVEEERLNTMGYQLLQSGKRAEAIAIFRLNVELYPASSNVYDSLGEGYMVTGEREKAIASYEKSLELNPQNANRAKMLEKLKAGGSQK